MNITRNAVLVLGIAILLGTLNENNVIKVPMDLVQTALAAYLASLGIAYGGRAVGAGIAVRGMPNTVNSVPIPDVATSEVLDKVTASITAAGHHDVLVQKRAFEDLLDGRPRHPGEKYAAGFRPLS